MPHVELLSDGKVPVVRQASILWFLVSLHSAFWRRLLSLSALGSDAGLVELRSQMWREAEIVTQLLSIMPRFPPMFVNPVLLWNWEAGWLPSSAAFAAGARGLLIDAAALSHAAHASIRPAAILPAAADLADAFPIVLHRIEFESGRLVQRKCCCSNRTSCDHSGRLSRNYSPGGTSRSKPSGKTCL